MLEAPVQTFIPSPFFRNIQPSPTEALTFNVAGALLALGLNYTELQETIADSIWAFLNTCTRAAEGAQSPRIGPPDDFQLGDAIRTVTVAVALMGFMDAASAQADFWKASGRLALIQKLRQMMSEPFLVAVETALSTIRNAPSQDREVREWKRLVRHYAASDRPLGAMLLQRSFLWLVVSTTSLMVSGGDYLRGIHVLDLHMSRGAKLNSGPFKGVDNDLHSIEFYTGLAIEQMNYIEAGADFVRLGTSAQQKLAYAVKSAAIISFLNCSILNEEVADADTLFNWLQETLEDTFQMADQTLASVVLKSLALTCQVSPSFSSTVSRVLPRFMVQNAPQVETVTVASQSLAFVLKLLSKDAVISTLYTLGNVLSPESDRTFTNGQTNGSPGDLPLTSVYTHQPSMGSAISLRIKDNEESVIVYENVVKAICGIASACQDEKITALAQSMLLQKLDKVNNSVDAQIITGAATLALSGGQLEFRSLLKMYTRMCHIGVVDNKDFLLAAVSAGPSGQKRRQLT